MPGDVGRQIRAAIQRADYVVVVLDDLRPNVLYELGLAHGQDKPTILLNRRGSLESDVVPFDLTMQQRLEYDEISRELPERLQQTIRALARP
jgi:nucleoside 2-deoxyribosyltransferase